MGIRDFLAEISSRGEWEKREDTDVFCKTFSFTEIFPVFQGHFPGKPVLPAVVQCIMAEMTLEEMRNKSYRTEKIVQGKFLLPVVPPCLVQCIVASDAPWAKARLFVEEKEVARIEWVYYETEENI